MPSAAITVEERQAAIRALNGAVAPTVTNAIFEGLNMTIFGGLSVVGVRHRGAKTTPQFGALAATRGHAFNSAGVFVSGLVCQGLNEIDSQRI